MIKFLKVNINYKLMMDDFLKKHPAYQEIGYSEFCEKYYDEFYWPGNALETELNKKGILANNLIFLRDGLGFLYQKWCKYYDATPILSDDPFQQLLHQIYIINPDIIYLDEIWMFSNNFFNSIKLINPNIKVLGWNGFLGSHNFSEGQNYIDTIFTCLEDHKVNLLQHNFKQVKNIGHFFDERILDLSLNSNIKYDVVFIGKALKSLYSSRVDMLLYLLSAGVNIKVFGDTDDEILKEHTLPAVYGKDFYRVIANSKVVINLHLDNSKSAGNIRMFETTGLGSFLLTDDLPYVDKYFAIGKEVDAFSNKYELLEKINFYLNEPEKRKKIALAGQKRTLDNYTYKNQANIFFKEISNSKKQNIDNILDVYTKGKNITLLNARYTLNKIINKLNKIAADNKVIIIGGGNFSTLIRALNKNIVATLVDKDLVTLPKYKYDCLVIVAVGYEEKIKNNLIQSYGVDESKILQISELV